MDSPKKPETPKASFRGLPEGTLKGALKGALKGIPTPHPLSPAPTKLKVRCSGYCGSCGSSQSGGRHSIGQRELLEAGSGNFGFNGV